MKFFLEKLLLALNNKKATNSLGGVTDLRTCSPPVGITPIKVLHLQNTGRKSLYCLLPAYFVTPIRKRI